MRLKTPSRAIIMREVKVGGADMDYSNYQRLKVNKEDGVAVVTLNRPEVLNAVDGQMHFELSTIFADLNQDPEVKAVVMTGAGRAFSAGGDIKWLRGLATDVAHVKMHMGESRRIVTGILDLEAPIIAAVNGPVVGLGATVALFCDMIIASEKAHFSDPHVRVGLVAGDGGAVIWPLLVGVARAKQYLMTGDTVSAREAERIGLVNQVVAEEELMPTALALAKRLASGPTLAISWTKMAVNKLLKREVNLILDDSLAWEYHCFHAEDFRESTAAFLEKRKPLFKGK